MSNNRTTNHIATPKDGCVLLTAQLTGAGGANMVNAEAANLGGGEVVSATRTGAGAFNLVFRNKYPQLKTLFRPMIVGTTAGLGCRFTAIDVKAGTAAVVFEVAGVATDPAATDTAHLQWMVRNSGRNT
jgi:hypothetical protein